ncbi:hypothetical protein PS627_02598 [Pseudomonas fluorescens]|nr:hypothetical protein PS627_02598 [Pseudomonas fluorescens]VVP82173.1 hypothetical protein PS910_02072 [Pseudomonas fluorescens]
MYAIHSPRLCFFPRTGASRRQTNTQRVDPCASAEVYNAPRFICDSNAYSALLLTSG